MNIQLYQLFWCESKGSLGCWQRLDGFSLMIASHLRVGWCLVLVRHTIYIQLVIYLNHHFYNWWPSWCRWRWRRCQTGQVGSPGYSKLWRRAFFWFSTLDLVRLKDAEWMFWKDSKCRCFQADLWNFGVELLSGPNEDLDDLFLQMSKCCW